MGRRAGWLLVTAFLLLAGPEAARPASFPPELRFRSVSTDRVTVHFHQGLEQMARRAASLATDTTTAARPSLNSVRIDSPSSWPPNRGKSAAPGIHTTRSAGRPTSRQRASICRDTANATAVRRCSAVAATPRLTERALW
jgi:hypothetical protein